jgi:hypothetical protein
MAYHIKGFNDWKTHRVNEGIVDLIKNASKKLLQLIAKVPGLAWIDNKFKGTNSWFLNNYMRQEEKDKLEGIYFRPDKLSKQIADEALGKQTTLEQPINVEAVLKNNKITEAKTALESPDIEMENVSPQELADRIEVMITAVREGFSPETMPRPIIIWGAVGIGKTAIVQNLADKYNMQVETISLASVDPDLFLLPGVDEETGLGTIRPTELLPLYDSRRPNAAELEARVNGVIGEDGKPQGGILFLDEVTRASSQRVTNAMLGLINERRLNHFKVASRWIIVGAANRSRDDYEGIVTSSAFNNRFTHINFVPTVSGVRQFADTFVDKDTGELIIDPVMVEFLEFNKELLHSFDPDNTENIVFPTIRSWTMAAQNVATTKKAYKIMNKKFTDRDLEKSVAMAVGKSAAREYFGYLNLIKSIDPKTIKLVYTNPERAMLPVKERGQYKSDIASAFMTAIILDKKGEKLSKEEIENVYKYSIRLDNPNWAMVLIRSFIQAHPELWPQNIENDMEMKSFFAEMSDKFNEAYPGYDINKDM